MGIKAYRVVKKKFAKNAFNGVGAKNAGGRWNSKDTPAVYLSSTLSQAILEVLVHLEDSELLSKAYVYFEVSFDESLVEAADLSSLPKGWDAPVAGSASQDIGDLWVSESRSVVFQVPSAIVPGEINFVVNPLHGDFAKIKIASPASMLFAHRLDGKH